MIIIYLIEILLIIFSIGFFAVIFILIYYIRKSLSLEKRIIELRKDYENLENKLILEWSEKFTGISEEIKNEISQIKVPQKIMEHLRSIFSEQLERFVPFLTSFTKKYDPRDAIFIGKPIDYIVFDGKSKKKIEKIVFIEVKSKENPKIEGIEADIMKIIKQHKDKIDWDLIDITKGEKIISREEVAKELGETDYPLKLKGYLDKAFEKLRKIFKKGDKEITPQNI